MGSKLKKSKSTWTVIVKVSESTASWDEDSYDGTKTGLQFKEVDHIDQTVTAETKDDAIVKAIRHLNLELSTDDVDAPAE